MKIFNLIAAIRKRPRFFLLNLSIYDFDAFLRGYHYYQFSHEIDKTDEDIAFDEFKTNWLRQRLGLKGKPSYIQCLMFDSDNESEALEKFFCYWNEFIQTLHGSPGAE